MDIISQGLDFFLHLNEHLERYATDWGPWLYVVLFAIIFLETGLVVTPILPGDSLLFAVGALAGAGIGQLSILMLLVLLIIAAVAGDAANYAIGYWLGPKVFKYEQSLLFNKKHLVRTQRFYQRYGSKTIVLARFIPIVRTFAPFVAGIGKMQYRRFAAYNVLGGVAWVAAFLLLGYFLGERLKAQFSIIVLAIIVISVMPLAIEFFLARRRRLQQTPVPANAE
jgi:membrane-associated protein